ncbi:TetR/AcrR family transcriptional regulator [Moraxella osloensis]|nr:TetR family transcriptional regulator [Enhydrobacter sp. AX1]QCR86518.1 TetR/AcrR family transcriptional regulator [Moraxella osloensis]VXA92684.1 TetR family transcriptional regulator [Enhydrobacter sp. AX1]
MTLSRNKSPDLRVVKTHKAIREAFILLLSEQEYNDIAIQAILNRAKVNRATFYKYYSGKGDLARQMIDDFKQEVSQLFQDRLNADSQMLQMTMENHSQKLFERRQQMLALWKIRTQHHNLYHDMFLMGKQNFIELAKKQKATDYLTAEAIDYQATMMATVFMASLKYFYERDLPLPKNLPVDWQQMLDIIKS